MKIEKHDNFTYKYHYVNSIYFEALDFIRMHYKTYNLNINTQMTF